MSKTGTILSVMKPIADILMNNYTPYFIPDFQRDFVWGEKEVTELWEDIKADTDVFQKKQMNWKATYWEYCFDTR